MFKKIQKKGTTINLEEIKGEDKTEPTLPDLNSADPDEK